MAEINVDIERARILVARIAPRGGADPTAAQSIRSLAQSIVEVGQRLQSTRGGGGDPLLAEMLQKLVSRSSAGMATLERLSSATDTYLQNLEKAKRR